MSRSVKGHAVYGARYEVRATAGWRAAALLIASRTPTDAIVLVGEMSASNLSHPVIRPRKTPWKLFREALEHVRNHIGYVVFVGGEPLTHKELPGMVRYAAEARISPMICTNGSLWTDENMRSLARDGLRSVIMSIDSHEVARHEKNRGLPDVSVKIKRANEVFAELGIQTTASVAASRLIDDYQKLPDFLSALGFKSCTFSYPLTSLESSYLSFSDSSLVNYETGELIGVFEKMKQMKARGAAGVESNRVALGDAAALAK